MVRRWKFFAPLLFGSIFGLLLFQNMATLTSIIRVAISNTPERPLRNIDTRTLKIDSNGKIRAISSLIPIHDTSIDGRLGILHNEVNQSKTAKGNYVPIVLMKPEGVNSYVSNSANDWFGGGFLSQVITNNIPNYLDTAGLFNLDHFRTAFPNQLINPKYERTIICERTDLLSNPRVCGANSDRDCYDITLINRASVTDSAGNVGAYLVSVDVRVRILQPKSMNARVEHVFVRPNTYRISGMIPFTKIAEPIVVGDNRLLIARANNETMLTTNNVSVPNTNIFYSVYPARNNAGNPTLQCDVTKWIHSSNSATNRMHPITHAYYDTRNNMRNRYKFARYPFRDGIGNVIPDGVDLGGSYPWMDRGAANLVFTTFGNDPFYSFSTSSSGVQEIKVPYAEQTISAAYQIPAVFSERDFFEHFDRTLGVAIAGFWTYGKVVLFDGLINNVDFGFRVAPKKVAEGVMAVEPTRKLKLYSSGAEEPVAAGRERGDDVVESRYLLGLGTNTHYLGSLENRFNYLEQSKPVTPRDIVWTLGSLKHTAEIVLDDYISPYTLIYSEMTAATGGFDSATKSSIYYDGVYQSQAVTQVSVSNGFPALPTGRPLLFQNAASAPANVLAVPKYGKPIGLLRTEPIAKGGVEGKGVWLEENNGLSYLIPTQSANSVVNLSGVNKFYIGTFIDIRTNFPSNTSGTQFSRTLFSITGNSANKKIQLVRGSSLNTNIFNYIQFLDGSTLVGSFQFPNTTAGDLRLQKSKWYHIGFSFDNSNGIVAVYLNGYKLGLVSRSSNISETTFRSFFALNANHVVTLGTSSTNMVEAIRGWYDDFRLHVRAPTVEEACNYARGTLINVRSNTSWQSIANGYPETSHQEVRSLLNQGSSSANKYACYVNYGSGSYDNSNLSEVDVKAHLKNLPANTLSVREDLLQRFKDLRYDAYRPNYSGNSFCLSCHLPISSGVTFPEMDTQALLVNTQVALQDDKRRQPHQPPRKIRGVIPANYFGQGKPINRLAERGVAYDVDQWILPTLQNSNVTVAQDENQTCEFSTVYYEAGAYEKACGCQDITEGDLSYYPHDDLGTQGQSCEHKFLGARDHEKERGRNQFLLYSNGRMDIAPNVFIIMQNDGNLVMYNGGNAVWSSGTWNQCTTNCAAIFQNDGNFVIYRTTQSGWIPIYGAPNTWGRAVKMKFTPWKPYVQAVDANGIRVWYDPDMIVGP